MFVLVVFWAWSLPRQFKVGVLTGHHLAGSCFPPFTTNYCPPYNRSRTSLIKDLHPLSEMTYRCLHNPLLINLFFSPPRPPPSLFPPPIYLVLESSCLKNEQWLFISRMLETLNLTLILILTLTLTLTRVRPIQLHHASCFHTRALEVKLEN